MFIGCEERHMQVRDILRTKGNDVVVIPGDATLAEAARLLSRKQIGAVVIRDMGGSLSGILSERDLVRALAKDSIAALSQSVRSYMTKAVATCTEFDTVDVLMEMMTRGRFRHVPVLDAEDEIIGIISIGDVVKTRIEESEHEARSLRDYIATG
jgi:CBS domain-containing protein